MKSLSKVFSQGLVLLGAFFCLSELHAAEGYVTNCTQSASHTITLSAGWFGLGGSWSLTTNLYDCKVLPETGGKDGNIYPVHPFKGSEVNTATGDCMDEDEGVPVTYNTFSLIDFLIPMEWIPDQFHRGATIAKRTIKIITAEREYMDVYNATWGCEPIPGRGGRPSGGGSGGGGSGHQYR